MFCSLCAQGQEKSGQATAATQTRSSVVPRGSANKRFHGFDGKIISRIDLDQFILDRVRTLGLPGLSVAVIDDGRIVYDKTFEAAATSAGAPLDEGSMFEAASLSKTAFAYLVLKMVDKGLLRLDEPLYRYMPYPDIASDDRYKLITARMVLSHQTGFPNWRYNEKPDPGLHIVFPSLWLKFTPGTQFSYSGEGYDYLARVVASVNHKDLHTLDSVYQQEVSRPLRLAHFYFTSNTYVLEHKAVGHVDGRVDNSGWPSGFPEHDPTRFGAAEGLHTEATDYARFLIALMEHKGIRKSTLSEMLKPEVNFPPNDPIRVKAGYSAWGLGIAIKPTAYGTVYAHPGNNGNFTSGFEYLKDRKRGFVFFTNCDKGDLFNKSLAGFLGDK
jgi:CubicO group peptidase (beta-lactamase class C family)